MLTSGVTLTLRLGKQKTKPAPRLLVDALQTVEVTHRDKGRAGFQIVFEVGRLGKADVKDYQLIKHPVLTAGNRCIILITLNASTLVLMDGIITHQQLSPSAEPGASTFTITGEDVSVLMDRTKSSVEHPAQDPKVIVEQLLGNYSRYGVIPDVASPPKGVNAPSADRHTPVKFNSDLKHIWRLAGRYGYVFYILPGPKVEKNTAYWGPPKKRGSQPQRALSVNMGAYTNVESINFRHDSLAPTKVFGRIQDGKTNEILTLDLEDGGPGRSFLSKTLSVDNEVCVQDRQYLDSGHSLVEAQIRAQAIIDQSVDNAVKVSGEIDSLRYGDILQVRKLVGLRGVGNRYDGLYYVQQVTHKLRKGEYKQSFIIAREGLDSTVSSLHV